MFQICSISCDESNRFPYNLSEEDRDTHNDRINGQLETLLMELQQLNTSCNAEQNTSDCWNSSLLSVCTTLKLKLQTFAQNISKYVSQ